MKTIIIMPVLASAYFPLQVGNTWTFLATSDSSKWIYEITDTKDFNEHVYFERVLTFSDGTKDTEYFRITENDVVLLNYDGKDYIYIDFEKPLEIEWNSYGNYYGFIKERNLSVQVAAGNFNKVTEVYFSNRNVSDIFQFNRYAPGVGLVESIRFRFGLKLINARVNGIDYP
ncbi:MAG: hypothetical protein EHM47_19060 [Ignavibacteriales bacterium]|nr:MAG: hypothetical protein EHM47_19060 [Ignavibacteriales bacterium]